MHNGRSNGDDFYDDGYKLGFLIMGGHWSDYQNPCEVIVEVDDDDCSTTRWQWLEKSIVGEACGISNQRPTDFGDEHDNVGDLWCC